MNQPDFNCIFPLPLPPKPSDFYNLDAYLRDAITYDRDHFFGHVDPLPELTEHHRELWFNYAKERAKLYKPVGYETRNIDVEDIDFDDVDAPPLFALDTTPPWI